MDPTEANLTSYRLGELERGVKEMRGDMREAVVQLNVNLTALQTQLSNYQSSISEKYVSRTDFNRTAEVTETWRTDMANRVDDLYESTGKQGWGVAIALAGAALSAVVAAIGWLRPPH